MVKILLKAIALIFLLQFLLKCNSLNNISEGIAITSESYFYSTLLKSLLILHKESIVQLDEKYLNEYLEAFGEQKEIIRGKISLLRSKYKNFNNDFIFSYNAPIMIIKNRKCYVKLEIDLEKDSCFSEPYCWVKIIESSFQTSNELYSRANSYAMSTSTLYIKKKQKTDLFEEQLIVIDSVKVDYNFIYTDTTFKVRYSMP